MPDRLSQKDRTTLLSTLTEWTELPDQDAIFRSFCFRDFAEAWRFMGACAEEAERIQHHPEWFNVWNRVDVTLRTHDCGGLSALDIALAQFMNRAYEVSR